MHLSFQSWMVKRLALVNKPLHNIKTIKVNYFKLHAVLYNIKLILKAIRKEKLFHRFASCKKLN